MSQKDKIEESEIVLHEHDPKIDTIRIKMPSVEAWYSDVMERDISREEALTYVDGYGLQEHEQKFRHVEQPEKIVNIYSVVAQKMGKKVDKVTTEELFQELDNNPFYYEYEIKWIQREIKRRFYGYWFYNNGVPTYMNGWAYTFFNYWTIENEGKNGNRPEYRNFHRKVFHAIYWSYTTTFGVFKHKVMYDDNGTFKNRYFNSYEGLMNYVATLKKEGIAHTKQMNKFYAVDMKKRTILGPNIFKARRQGLTAVINCCQFCVANEAPNRNTTIAGLTKDSVKEVFSSKIVPPIDGLPFYLIPKRARENQAVAAKLSFDYGVEDKRMWKAGQIPPPLNSSIRMIGSHHTAVDGTRQYFMTKDEFLKVPDGASKSEINEWLAVSQKCLMDGGSTYIGLMALASTVPKMKEGGTEGKELAERSHYANRNDNGQTLSGQVNIFLSAYDGDPAFIDEYGNTVYDDPIDPVYNQKGELITQGAKTFFDSQIRALEEAGDLKGVVEQKHMYPRFFEEVWEEDREENGFPIIRMAARAKTLNDNPYSGMKRGDFEWTNGLLSKVRFVDNEDGKWYVSYHPQNGMTNSYHFDPSEGMFAPDPRVLGKFYLGADPVRFNRINTVGGKKSKGSFAIFYAYDPIVDHSEIPRDKWVSNKFIASFKNDVEDVEDYGWEGVKAMMYFGAMCYPEISEPNFLQFLQRQKMFKFLLHDVSPDGTISSKAGYHASEPWKQDMFKNVMTHFQQSVEFENHPDIIEEWMRIRGIDDLTNRDLAASTGGALQGSRSMMIEMMQREEEQTFIDSLLPIYDVS